ncbi:MAG: glycosyltransferase [Fibrobacterales bacterium]
MQTLSLIALLSYAISSGILISQLKTIEQNPSMIFLTIIMFFSMTLLWRQRPSSKFIYGTLAFSIVIKIGFFLFPVNGDIFRYLWEGKIQLHGFNPFHVAPDSQELLGLRDGIWGRVNHKDYTTIYWPLAQILFKTMYDLFGSVTSYRILFLIFDIGMILMLRQIILLRKKHMSNLLLYGLNPLILIYTMGEAHLEILPLFFVVLAYLLYLKKQWVWLYISIGMAIMIKAPYIIFLPLFINRKNVIHLSFICIPFYLIFAYLETPLDLLLSLTKFTTSLSYNGLLHSLISLVVSEKAATFVVFPIAALLYTTIFFVTPMRSKAIFNAALVFILCSPTFHPWYLIMVTPFLVLHPSRPVLLLHLTVIPLVFRYNDLVVGSFWHNELFLQLIEYVPFVLATLIIFERQIKEPSIGIKRSKITVIIPTLNEGKNITACLDSLMYQKGIEEIIVVDAGSHDKTRNLARAFENVSVVIAEKGRGNQILTGIEEATSNAIAVVHADTILKGGAIESIIETLDRSPAVYGGALGARYSDSSIKFTITQTLNTLRAKYLGISFGDQVQFFRTAYIKAKLQPFRLMEDIEIALLIKEQGDTVFIPGYVECSTRTWTKRGFVENFKTVIHLTGLFLIKRRLGTLSKDCNEFYLKYYGK